jgi:hypothetical protein
MPVGDLGSGRREFDSDLGFAMIHPYSWLKFNLKCTCGNDIPCMPGELSALV